MGWWRIDAELWGWYVSFQLNTNSRPCMPHANSLHHRGICECPSVPNSRLWQINQKHLGAVGLSAGQLIAEEIHYTHRQCYKSPPDGINSSAKAAFAMPASPYIRIPFPWNRWSMNASVGYAIAAGLRTLEINSSSMETIIKNASALGALPNNATDSLHLETTSPRLNRCCKMNVVSILRYQ